jgi:hypothetical protein
MRRITSENTQTVIEIKRTDAVELQDRPVMLEFEFEQYAFSDETAKRLGQALIDEAES